MLTVGDILKKTREKQNIPTKEVEKRIKVRIKFLEAIECNNWNFFSSKIYITGIIKNYSEYLGLDPKKMLAFFRRDYERSEEISFKKRVSSQYLTPETKRVAMIILAVIFLIFFGYFGYQLKQYLSPPELTVISPQKVSYTVEDKLRFVGRTDKDAAITIFGERIFQDKYGMFEYDLPLHEGKNQLIIQIVGANGKQAAFTETYVKKSPQ